jgi:hypothetical protein
MSAAVLRRIIIWPITSSRVLQENAGTISPRAEDVMKIRTAKFLLAEPEEATAAGTGTTGETTQP